MRMFAITAALLLTMSACQKVPSERVASGKECQAVELDGNIVSIQGHGTEQAPPCMPSDSLAVMSRYMAEHPELEIIEKTFDFRGALTSFTVRKKDQIL